MMGRQSGQISMLFLDIEELIPEKHLLRKINHLTLSMRSGIVLSFQWPSVSRSCQYV